MSIIEFNSSNREAELPIEDVQSNIPYLYLLPKKDSLPDLQRTLKKSVDRKPIKLDIKSKTDKIIDKALIIATITGLIAILWYLHETLGINNITTANIPEIMNKLSVIEPNILLDNTLSTIKKLR